MKDFWKYKTLSDYVQKIRNVTPSTHNSIMPAQGQSHNRRSRIFSFTFRVRFISPLPLKGFSLNFNQMFSLHRQCAGPIIQPCGPKVKVAIECHV